MADRPGAVIDTASLVDANLIVWAHHRQFPLHAAARRWWRGVLSEHAQVGITVPTDRHRSILGP